MSTPHPHELTPDHPTAVAFLDESGSIASDRFFAVGCLKLPEPNRLIREVESWRDRHHWYREIHFVDLTRDALPRYREVIDIVAESDGEFSCFVADRQVADAVARYGSPWRAYEMLAAQLLVGSVRRREILTVLADWYRTPAGVSFEEDVRAEVNGRLQRLVIASIVRLDSRAATPIQLADLLTSAVTYEFRENAGLAGAVTPKAQLARYFRERYGVSSLLAGSRTSRRLNVALYRDTSGVVLVRS